MKIAKTYVCNIPNWAVCYLEYAETDGLSKEDIEVVDKWLEALELNGYTNPVFVFGKDNGYHEYPEFGLGCGCIQCTIHQFERE